MIYLIFCVIRAIQGRLSQRTTIGRSTAAEPLSERAMYLGRTDTACERAAAAAPRARTREAGRGRLGRRSDLQLYLIYLVYLIYLTNGRREEGGYSAR